MAKSVRKPSDIRHPLYWNRVKLGALLIGGIAALPLFLLGVLVATFRRIHDRVAGAVTKASQPDEQ